MAPRKKTDHIPDPSRTTDDPIAIADAAQIFQNEDSEDSDNPEDSDINDGGYQLLPQDNYDSDDLAQGTDDESNDEDDDDNIQSITVGERGQEIITVSEEVCDDELSCEAQSQTMAEISVNSEVQHFAEEKVEDRNCEVDAKMDSDKAETIKAVMANIKLPQKDIPVWAMDDKGLSLEEKVKALVAASEENLDESNASDVLSERVKTLVDESKASQEKELLEEQAKLWNKRKSAEGVIEIDEEKADTIKEVMAKIQLPAAVIPPWAIDVKEDIWKQKLLDKIKLSNESLN